VGGKYLCYRFYLFFELLGFNFLKGKIGWWYEEECCLGGGLGLIGPHEGGKGLRRDLRVRKALAYGRNLQSGRKGSKDRTNGMKRKVTEPGEWSEPDEVDWSEME
jgi:hypothetical protein